MRIYEVVKEFRADDFPNSGRVARGRVLRISPDGGYTVTADETVKRVTLPKKEYPSAKDAEDALFEFWKQCAHELEGSLPDWREL